MLYPLSYEGSGRPWPLVGGGGQARLALDRSFRGRWLVRACAPVVFRNATESGSWAHRPGRTRRTECP